MKNVPGVTSALAERLTGGRYIDVDIDRDAAARYGLNIADVQSVVAAAIGGENIGETVEGLQRFPINVRYPRELRDSLERLARPADRDRARRADHASATSPTIRIADGPPMLKSENARLSGWVYVDVRGRDLRSAVRDMQRAVAERGEAAARLFDLLVGAVRVPGARDRAAEGRRAGHAADHLRAAVPDVPARSTRRC